MNNDSRDAHLMSGAYVLHALDPDERAEVEAAMMTSEDLRSEIAELSDTAVVLGLAVRAERPPAALRDRVLALTDSPQLAPLPEQVESAPLPAVRHLTGSAQRQANARWFRRPVVLVAAAAAAAVLFAGGLGVDRLVNPPAQTASITALSRASDLQTVEAAVAGGGTATVLSSASTGESAILLTGVDTPAAGHVYQLWRLNGPTITSAGLYAPSSGTGFEMIRGALKAGERYAVSVEPAGGSKQPTTTPIVAVPAA